MDKEEKINKLGGELYEAYCDDMDKFCPLLAKIIVELQEKIEVLEGATFHSNCIKGEEK